MYIMKYKDYSEIGYHGYIAINDNTLIRNETPHEYAHTQPYPHAPLHYRLCAFIARDIIGQ